MQYQPFPAKFIYMIDVGPFGASNNQVDWYLEDYPVPIAQENNARLECCYKNTENINKLYLLIRKAVFSSAQSVILQCFIIENWKKENAAAAA